MRYFKYLILAFILALPVNVFAGPPPPATQSRVDFLTTDRPDEEVYAYYDLRDRSTYVQVTNDEDVDNPLCIHVQIFQQDNNCDEINFNDTLTPNDTVVYDMDNLVRNDGSAVPVNLDDDSYGFVAISAVRCSTNSDDKLESPLLGNVRIIDDSGYEYRMNLATNRSSKTLIPEIISGFTPPWDRVWGNVIIPFNTVDGANQADVVGFIVENDRNLNGVAAGGDPDPDDDLVYNEEVGITFDVFQIDENEQRLSCDQVTMGCGPNVVLNHGINDDYPASRGNNLLCEGAGLNPGQTNGYISLENPTFLSPIDKVEEPPIPDFEFVCLVGLNNGDNTGSMDECRVKCIDEDDSDFNCEFNT